MLTIRTITGAVKYLKEQDPGSSITEYFLRTAARSGKLPGVRRSGKKYLICIEQLEDYLAGEAAIKNDGIEFGKLRKVK